MKVITRPSCKGDLYKSLITNLAVSTLMWQDVHWFHPCCCSCYDVIVFERSIVVFHSFAAFLFAPPCTCVAYRFPVFQRCPELCWLLMPPPSEGTVVHQCDCRCRYPRCCLHEWSVLQTPSWVFQNYFKSKVFPPLGDSELRCGEK